MKKIFVTLLICLASFSCSKDPISGLERGWIWDVLGIEEDDGIGEIKFEIGSTDCRVRLYEGVTTGGIAIFDSIFSGNSLYIKEFSSGKYTVTVNGNSSTINDDNIIQDSEDFTLKHCALLSSQYDGGGTNIYVYTVENGGIFECW